MIIKPDIKYTFTVERSLHISKAVIDFTSPALSYNVLTSLMVDCDDKKGIILCNLKGIDYHDHTFKPEADLDIYFRVGQRITLHSGQLFPEGERVPSEKRPIPRIHLSGYEFVV